MPFRVILRVKCNYIYVCLKNGMITGHGSTNVSCHVCTCLHLCTELHRFSPPFFCSKAPWPGALPFHVLPNSRHPFRPSAMGFSAPPACPSKALWQCHSPRWRHGCCCVTSAWGGTSPKHSIHFMWNSGLHSVFHIWTGNWQIGLLLPPSVINTLLLNSDSLMVYSFSWTNVSFFDIFLYQT